MLMKVFDICVGIIYLHTAQAHAERSGGASGAFGDLLAAFLGRSIVAVLPRAHLQIQHARPPVRRSYVLHHQEVCKHSYALSKAK